MHDYSLISVTGDLIALCFVIQGADIALKRSAIWYSVTDDCGYGEVVHILIPMIRVLQCIIY